MTRAFGRAGIGVLVVLVALAPRVAAQASDSLANRAPVAVARPDTAGAATRALRRSLVLPGWGQATNGQRAKVPIVAAALVGAAGVLVYQQRRTLLYRRAALFAGCRESTGRDVCADVASAEDEWVATGSLPFAQVFALREQARGRRDLAGLAVGIVYALQALDAYVAAQLLGFDVSEDVALSAAPDGVALRVRF